MLTENLMALWLIAGTILCLMEFLIPTAFVELAMGISAILVAFLVKAIPLGWQVVVWMGLSLLLVFLARSFLPNRKHYTIRDATSGKTLTEVAPGETGRVLFEGNSWQARNESGLLIPPNRLVTVIGRDGNTLIVMAESVDS
jgi:membrane protein implicated in regulation of membrane protease activity